MTGKFDEINSAQHYGGADNPYEAIKVIEAWGVTFCIGQVLKYVCRAGKKANESTVKDYRKAIYYLTREADKLEAQEAARKAQELSEQQQQVFIAEANQKERRAETSPMRVASELPPWWRNNG